MKASNILPLLALALPLGSAARALPGSATRVLPRHPQLQLPRADCETSDFISCIVSLAELPLQITTCLETVNDVNDLFTQINSGSTDPSNDATNTEAKIIGQGADCIAEAFLASVELPEHCSGCTKVLDGECSNADVPCTGPPPASNELR